LRLLIILTTFFILINSRIGLSEEPSSYSAGELGKLCFALVNDVNKPTFNASTEKSYSASAIRCHSYLGGFLDALVLAPLYIKNEKRICLPKEGVSVLMLSHVYLEWLELHPERIKKSGRTELLIALGVLYPCN
jgi:hypothetical protein